jgi:trimeric autotransporter adhesin
VGGNNSTGTLALNGAAPAGGATVTLQSSDINTSQVPSSVIIPAGSTSVNFTITTSGVASQTVVTLTATYGTTKTTTLTVNAASLTSLALNPSTVTRGASSTGTLTLNGAAPPSGAVISLKSSNTNLAQVPSSATIPAGSNSVTFTVTTRPVNGTSAIISGTYGSNTRSAKLTVQ